MRLFGALVLLALACAAQQPVTFERSIQPILSERCGGGPSDRNPSGKLSLSSGTALFRGGQSGPAVHAGRPDESLLVQIVSGEKPRMPKFGTPLTPDQVSLIRRWIAEGARVDAAAGGDQTWWSLRPLVRPAAPAAASGIGPVDAFLREKLRSAGLAPSPEANRRTLIRRLYFDLH